MNQLQRKIKYKNITTVKEEVSPTMVNNVMKNIENIKCEFTTCSEYTTCTSGNFDMITTIKYEACSDTEESSSEVKCEYLELDNEISDNESNASRDSIDIKPHIIKEEDTDFRVHENINNISLHDDLFMIIVSDKKKKKNISPKRNVVKKKRLRNCKFCNKSYSTSYFSEHMKRVHGSKKQKAEAAQISAIKRKLKSKKVSCQICQKLVSKVNYKPHFATHDPNKSKYICDTCGKGFAQKRFLVIHMVTHRTEFKYKCNLCPYKGRSSNHLRMHMKTHSMDYRYECEECPAKFLTKSNLNKHLQVHSQKESMYSCGICQMGFSLKVTLERHIEACHLGIKRHACNICGLTFGYRKAMLHHQVKIHHVKKKPHGRTPSYLIAEKK